MRKNLPLWGMLIAAFLFTLTPAFATTFLVINNDDNTPGSLRQAIGTSDDGDVIIFRADVNGANIVLNSPLVISVDRNHYW